MSWCLAAIEWKLIYFSHALQTALAFLVSCLIFAASLHDQTWRMFTTNSALTYSDVLSFLLLHCPVAPGLWASSAPSPPLVPHGPGATGTAPLCMLQESFPKCLNAASFTQNWWLQGADAHLGTQLCTLVFVSSLPAAKAPCSLGNCRGCRLPSPPLLCTGLSQTISTAFFKALLI